jgi:chemotaxis protein methyltransferase CheR
METGAALDRHITLGSRELRAIADLVRRKSGITLHDGKRGLIEARLHKRLRHIGVASYREYLHLVEADESGCELTALLDAIATNHTSFFREAGHFAILRDVVVPAFAKTGRMLTGWSAACSTGEEAYTMAMTLAEGGCVNYRLLASDLSTKALATARRGVYRMERVERIPMPLLRAYFERGLGDSTGLVRVASHLRQRIEFQNINLLEIRSLGRQFDVIFCRNVMIYFDQQARQQVVSMLERHLAPGGFLVIAHAETLNDVDHRLQPVAAAVFRRAL